MCLVPTNRIYRYRFYEQWVSPLVSEPADILHTVLPIARAYFMSEEFERAEGVLNELIPTVDASKDCVRSDSLPIFSEMI